MASGNFSSAALGPRYEQILERVRAAPALYLLERIEIRKPELRSFTGR